MNWFLIALLPPIFWSLTNHIDKYLLENYYKKGLIGYVFIFSAAAAILFLPIIVIIKPSVLGSVNTLAFQWF